MTPCDTSSQLGRLTRCVGLAILVYAMVLAAFGAYRVDPLTLIQDAGDDETHVAYAGLLSHLGVFGWIATTAVTLFAAGVVASARAAASRSAVLLLVAAGTLSALLGIDDFFMLHDRYVPQKIAYGVHGALALLVVGVFGRTLLANGGLGVLLAGVLLAGSIVVDLAQNHLPLGYVASQVVEEGLKFAGIACWLWAWSVVAANVLLRYGNPGNGNATADLRPVVTS